MRKLSYMQAGIKHYLDASDVPTSVPVFPISGAILLPSAQIPLHVFEPRYLAMIDHVMGSNRLIGIVQPSLDGSFNERGDPNLCDMGCVGRVTAMQETQSGLYNISVSGICRFKPTQEVQSDHLFRSFNIDPIEADFDDQTDASDIDADGLFAALEKFLDAHDLETDWDAIKKADLSVLVNSLSILAPFGPAEKQALLEETNAKTRAETLIALTEIDLASKSSEIGSSIQ